MTTPPHGIPRSAAMARMAARAVVDQPLVTWPPGYVLEVLSRVEDAVADHRGDRAPGPAQPGRAAVADVGAIETLHVIERHLEELDTDLGVLLSARPRPGAGSGTRATGVVATGGRSHSAVVDWPALITRHIAARRHEEAASPYAEGFALPNPGASEEAIAAVEERWGLLEATYRSFLAHADGWVGFVDGGDLLGTGALLDPATAETTARYLEECEVEPDELDVSEVLPLTTEIRGSDLVMLHRAGGRAPGQVVCWGHYGDEGRHPGFASYVASCTLRAGLSSELHGVARATVRENVAGDLGAQVAAARAMAAEPQAPWPTEVVVGCLVTLQAALAVQDPDDPRAGVPALTGAPPERTGGVQIAHALSPYSEHLYVLGLVDGWEHVIGAVDLLSTARLLDAETLRPLQARAQAVLVAVGLDPDGFSLVASSADGQDTVVLTGPGSSCVLWLRHQRVAAVYGSLDSWLVCIVVAHLAALDAAPQP